MKHRKKKQKFPNVLPRNSTTINQNCFPWSIRNYELCTVDRVNYTITTWCWLSHSHMSTYVWVCDPLRLQLDWSSLIQVYCKHIYFGHFVSVLLPDIFLAFPVKPFASTSKYVYLMSDLNLQVNCFWRSFFYERTLGTSSLILCFIKKKLPV